MRRYSGLRCARCQKPILPDPQNKFAIDFAYCPHCAAILLEKGHEFQKQPDFREHVTYDIFYEKIFIGTLWRRGGSQHAHPVEGKDKEFKSETEAMNFMYVTALNHWFIKN